MRLSSSMKAAVSAKFAEAGTGLDAQAIVAPHDAPRAPGDLGDEIGAEAVQDLIERALHRRQRGEMLDHAVAAFDRLARNDRIAVGVVSRARVEIALVVAEELEELRRERVAQIVEHIFPRRDVDREIAPFRGRDLREAAVEQRLVGRDDLQHDGMALLEIARDRGDQGRAFHRRQQMIEEALLVRFEGRARGGFGVAVVGAAVGAGDVGGLERLIQIAVDDLEGVGIGVVDADLLGREPMLDDFVFDALEGQRARGVEAERLEIAGQHFHGGDAAAFHGRDKIRAGRERKITGAPQAEPRGIGEVLNRRGAGGRDIENARVMQRVLQAETRLALLRRLLLAALALVAGGVGHGMRFVEDDDAVEVAAEPVDDLLNAARLFALRLGAQGRVGGEEDAFLERDRRALAEARERHDVGAVAADRRPVALGVLDQLVGFGDPERAAAALEPVVENDGGDLAALAGAGAVAEEPAAPEAHRVRRVERERPTTRS